MNLENVSNAESDWKHYENINKTYWWAQDIYMDIKGLWDIGYEFLSEEDKKWEN